MFNIVYVYNDKQNFDQDYRNNWNNSSDHCHYSHEYSFQSYHINKDKQILEIWSGRPNDSWQTFKYSEIKRFDSNIATNIAITVLE